MDREELFQIRFKSHKTDVVICLTLAVLLWGLTYFSFIDRDKMGFMICGGVSFILGGWLYQSVVDFFDFRKNGRNYL
jgi:lipoprotein signal peptidase